MARRTAYICREDLEGETDVQLWNGWQITKVSGDGLDDEPRKLPKRYRPSQRVERRVEIWSDLLTCDRKTIESSTSKENRLSRTKAAYPREAGEPGRRLSVHSGHRK